MKSYLKIIMYHYVRPLHNSRFSEIKGLDLKKFRNQLEYIEKNYEVITHKDVIDALNENKHLPKNSVWLTFDDGYKDHINFVLPLLEEFGYYGTFFPPAKPIKEGKLLDVNAIHHILAEVNNINSLLDLLKKEMENFGFIEKDWQHYWKTIDKSSRYDDPEVIFFKRLLQRELPENIRTEIISKIFEEIVNIKEADFAKNLYMSIDDLKVIISRNHGVGSHTYSHRWLDSLNAAEQKKEVDISIKFLEEIGVNTNNWMMCYPYGSFNKTTVDLLKVSNCCLGLTTNVGEAKLGTENRYSLPRYDTNDFPR